MEDPRLHFSMVIVGLYAFLSASRTADVNHVVMILVQKGMLSPRLLLSTEINLVKEFGHPPPGQTSGSGFPVSQSTLDLSWH